MSLTILRSALTRMDSTGQNGFEGLAATLLSALTGDRFYVARSGNQPADAIAQEGDIAIQGKRYDDTRLDMVRFEGEFSKASRLCKNLDCYVLATTQADAQICLLARELEAKTGVDILVIEFAGEYSELPSLCVTFWEHIQHFPELADIQGISEWANKHAKVQGVVETVQRLREHLKESAPLAATIRRRIDQHLSSRFGIDASSTRPSRFAIRLSEATFRAAASQSLAEWWNRSNSPAAVVIGDEGVGKSTAAAAWADWAKREGGAIVLWLDSADWTGLSGLSDIIGAGLTHIGVANHRLRERLVLKSTSRWSARLLVVLDGVNERNARATAHRLLAELYSTETQSFRVLFTSRPIMWRSDERALWNHMVQVPIGPFTEQELCQALQRLPTPVPRREIPEGLLEIAKIPRYFHRCVDLRGRFTSFANVSKEMVLWAELLAKVEAGDSQVVDSIGWSSGADVKRALLKLAESARSLAASQQATPDGYQLLQTSFGAKFEQIRMDLAEQRILLDPCGENPLPSPAHVILGFALHLGSIASDHATESIPELAERVQRVLEPVLSQDELTEAMFVALQLSAFPSPQGQILSANARAALLLTWVTSQNSRVDPRRLHFWAGEDILAYLSFVEELFVEPVSEGWTDLISTPLVEMWRTLGDRTTQLDTHLRQWLKLFWRSYDLPKAPLMRCGQYQLPVGKSRSQLSLGCIATAVLSRRPDNSFLPDIAIAWATDHLSKQRHSFPKKPDGSEIETQDLPCKDHYSNLGALLRWCYPETVREELQTIPNSCAVDDLLKKGTESLIETLDNFGWKRLSSPEQDLREGKPFFQGGPENCRNRFGGDPKLAIRDDLPDLCINDREIIADKIERAFRSRELHAGYSATDAELELELHFTWFAKYYPDKLAELSAIYRLESLDHRELGPSLHFANQLPYNSAAAKPSDLLQKCKQWAEREHSTSPERLSWAQEHLHILAITCFSETELRDWLLFASKNVSLRQMLHVYQIRLLSPKLMAHSLAAFAREKAKGCSQIVPIDPNEPKGEFEFWAWLGGLAGGPDYAFHVWVDEQVRQRRPSEMRFFFWAMLWFRTATDAQLDVAVESGTILDFLREDGWEAMHAAGYPTLNWSKCTVNLRSMISRVPMDIAGVILHLARRYEDLDKWGSLVFEAAVGLLKDPPFNPTFWGETTYTLDNAGRIAGSDFDHESPRETSSSLRPPTENTISRLMKQRPLADLEREANEKLKLWRQDQDRLKEMGARPFNRFGASAALETWRDRNSQRFTEKAKEFLQQVAADPWRAFQVGGFARVVLDLLAPLDTDFARRHTALLRSSPIPQLVDESGTKTFEAALWRTAHKGNRTCREACFELIASSQTDEELIYHAVAAQTQGATQVLLDFCDKLLSAAHPKDRCLAVSLLPWVAGAAQLELLVRLASNDPSGWVRKHAGWAAEVALQESSIRRHYQRTLAERDNNIVISRLQAMKPALTPTALYWHSDLERGSMDFQSAPPGVQAAIALFWNDARRQCNKTPELFGRKLSEYLRGERVRDLHPPRPLLVAT